MSCRRAVSNVVAFSKNIRGFSQKQLITRSISQTAYLRARIIEVVPALGESITEGSIASWSKNVGDSIAVDDVIVIVETVTLSVSTITGFPIVPIIANKISFLSTFERLLI